MALLYCDSFDHYATADIALKYPVHTIGAAADGPNITTGRFGNGIRMTYSNVTPGATTSTRRTIDGLSATTVIVGFAYFWTTQTTNDVQIVSLYEGSTLQTAIKAKQQQPVHRRPWHHGRRHVVAHQPHERLVLRRAQGVHEWLDWHGRSAASMGPAAATFTGNTLNGGTWCGHHTPAWSRSRRSAIPGTARLPHR